MKQIADKALSETNLDIPEITEPSVSGTNVSVAWSPTNEKIAVEWCDIAQCYKWLHYTFCGQYLYGKHHDYKWLTYFEHHWQLKWRHVCR